MKLNFLRILSNLNFAIILLLIIAIFSVVGTIIEQDQNIDYYYKTYSNFYLYKNINFYQVILLLGLNHVYKTWWFFLLIFVFGTCLISCTFTQQFPLLKLARRANFKFRISQFRNQEYQGTINSFYFIQSLKSLKIKKYNIFQQQNFVYLYKGILGRFAPIVVHIGLLIILTGTVIGAIGNFNLFNHTNKSFESKRHLVLQLKEKDGMSCI
jgi:cytochrome c biogenesis protein